MSNLLFRMLLHGLFYLLYNKITSLDSWTLDTLETTVTLDNLLPPTISTHQQPRRYKAYNAFRFKISSLPGTTTKQTSACSTKEDIGPSWTVSWVWRHFIFANMSSSIISVQLAFCTHFGSSYTTVMQVHRSRTIPSRLLAWSPAWCVGTSTLRYILRTSTTLPMALQTLVTHTIATTSQVQVFPSSINHPHTGFRGCRACRNTRIFSINCINNICINITNTNLILQYTSGATVLYFNITYNACVGWPCLQPLSFSANITSVDWLERRDETSSSFNS